MVEDLATDASHGLSSQEAAGRLTRYGANELDRAETTRPFVLLMRQFTNTMILVLAVAGAVTFVIGERIDTLVIGVIVVLNAVIGFLQEHRAEQAMAALRRMTTTKASTLRDGAVTEIPATALVPGDVVHLRAGDVVPADLRLLEVHALRVAEAPLTGESEPVVKSSDAVPPGAAVADRSNMAYKATAATYGRATGVVVATGMGTEVGRIAELLRDDETKTTPLQRRLAVLGRRLAVAAVVVCAVVFTSGIASGEPAEKMFITAVSLAVAAIPEGLPAVVTVALALGARRMAARRAVIRRLPAVETLGSVSVVCADKTGTLTENRMAVERVWTPSGSFTVDGRAYDPTGTVTTVLGDRSGLERVAAVAAACNDSVLRPPAEVGDAWEMTGDPTEGALATLAGRLGVDPSAVGGGGYARVGEVPFDADRRRMTTVHRAGADGLWIATKGALDALGPLLHDGDHDVLQRAEEVAQQLAASGYRVLALADRSIPAGWGAVPEPAELESELRLVGLVAIADPPRAEAADAVARCRGAGITPVMITGDHPRTAAAIAGRLGLIDPEVDDGRILTGADLDQLSDDELAARVHDVRVFARTSPEQKLRIVDAWQARGAVVAMTGDGVNDAPALQRSDIGVAMGITGTEVSKEASDMVLADDDFATIVAAVEEGRRIYDNIRRFIRYLLTTNSGEIWVMLLAPLLGLPVPLIATQILWINLVTDGLPAIALGMERPDPDTMHRGPRPADESILGRGLWQHALWVGLLMAAVVLPMQWLAREAGWPWQTMVFTTLALLQLGHAMAVRSELRSTFELGLLSNRWLAGAVGLSAALQLATVYVPWLNEAFDTVGLSPVQLAVVVAASTTAFVAVELEKLIRRRRTRLLATTRSVPVGGRP